MAEQEEISDPRESIVDKIPDKIDGGDDTSSSSSSDSDDGVRKEAAHSSVKENISRLFVREKPVDESFCGGTPADVFLWRDKKTSAAVLGGATAVWALFELLEYHLLTLVCHISILALSLLFLWSNASIFISKRPPHIPQVRLPKDPFIEVASVLQSEINNALAALREIAAGRDLKKFLLVVAVLWAVSIVGSCCSFLTLLYILFVVLHTVPVLYENYEDKIDAFAEKAMMEIKKQYAVFDAKILSKMPRGPLGKKRA